MFTSLPLLIRSVVDHLGGRRMKLPSRKTSEINRMLLFLFNSSVSLNAKFARMRENLILKTVENNLMMYNCFMIII